MWGGDVALSTTEVLSALEHKAQLLTRQDRPSTARNYSTVSSSLRCFIREHTCAETSFDSSVFGDYCGWLEVRDHCTNTIVLYARILTGCVRPLWLGAFDAPKSGTNGRASVLCQSTSYAQSESSTSGTTECAFQETYSSSATTTAGCRL